MAGVCAAGVCDVGVTAAGVVGDGVVCTGFSSFLLRSTRVPVPDATVAVSAAAGSPNSVAMFWSAAMTLEPAALTAEVNELAGPWSLSFESFASCSRAARLASSTAV